MSIIAALTDGRNIYISYDSLIRRVNEDMSLGYSNGWKKLNVINSRTAIGITGTWDWDREDYISEFVRDNASLTEFDHIFANLVSSVSAWKNRRADEDIAISLMGFNGDTPALRVVAVSGTNDLEIRSDFTQNMFSGHPDVRQRIGEHLRSAGTIMDVASELHNATYRAVLEFPDVVGPPVNTIILQP